VDALQVLMFHDRDCTCSAARQSVMRAQARLLARAGMRSTIILLGRLTDSTAGRSHSGAAVRPRCGRLGSGLRSAGLEDPAWTRWSKPGCVGKHGRRRHGRPPLSVDAADESNC